MYRLIYNTIKPIIPKISKTEMIALTSGGVSIDRDIFSGIFNKKELMKKNLKHDKNLIETVTTNTIKQVNDLPNDSLYNFSNYDKIMKILGKNKFLGFIIDKELGGNKTSVINQGRVLTKIASSNPSLGILTMVPNSLGPGELLVHYGTDEQKEKYLPGLTIGQYVPCFD